MTIIVPQRKRPVYVSASFSGRCGIFPVRDAMLLAPQAEWVKDDARLKVMEKSRQIGISWATAYRNVREQSKETTKLDSWVSSRDDLQARLFLEDCKSWAKVLTIGAKALGEKVIDEDGHSAYVLAFTNGTRTHSMSSNPDAQAGKRGSRTLDEFALHPDPRKLYSIAYPGITWGGSLEIISTHRGTANFFNQIIQEIKYKGNPKGFSLHTITLQDALDAGFLYKLQTKLPKEDERQQMDEGDYFNFIKAGCADEETFLQEYMCQPSDDASAFLSYELIDGCKYKPTDDWEQTLAQLAASPYPLYLGVDIGRVADLTVFWVVAGQPGGLRPTVYLKAFQNRQFSEQEEALYSLLSLPTLRRACMDNTGIGRQMVERAQQRFGTYKVEAITFTAGVKEELAYPLRAGFEDRTVRIPDDKTVIAHHRAIKKETTAAGNVRFAADRGPEGHADFFWGHALALHAGKIPMEASITAGGSATRRFSGRRAFL